MPGLRRENKKELERKFGDRVFYIQLPSSLCHFKTGIPEAIAVEPSAYQARARLEDAFPVSLRTSKFFVLITNEEDNAQSHRPQMHS